MIFIGDETIEDIYVGLNILLRENLGLGALKEWEMNSEERNKCRCDESLRGECRRWLVRKSEEVVKNSEGKRKGRSSDAAVGGSGYTCDSKTNIQRLITPR